MKAKAGADTGQEVGRNTWAHKGLEGEVEVSENKFIRLQRAHSKVFVLL